MTQQATTSERRFRRLATTAAFMSLFSYAICFTITPAAINQIGRFYNATPSLLGWLFRALMVGFFVAVLTAGRYSDRHGKLKAIWPGCVAMAIGLVLFGLTSNFGVALLATLIAGMGGGFSEGTAMALMADIYSGPRRTAMANWSQAMFGFGAIFAPLFIGTLIRTGVDWRTGYFGGGVVCAISALLAFKAAAMGHERRLASREVADWRCLVRDRLVITFVAGILLYVGAETGQANWLAVYYKVDLHTSASLAAWSVAVFWAGITAGRMVGGWICGRIPDMALVRWSLGLGVVFQIALLLLNSPLPGSIVTFVLGLCLGPVFPTISAAAGGAYPRQSGTVLGIVVSAGAVGGSIFPPAVGWLADQIGMRASLWTCVLVLIANLALFLNVHTRNRPAE